MWRQIFISIGVGELPQNVKLKHHQMLKQRCVGGHVNANPFFGNHLEDSDSVPNDPFLVKEKR